MPLPLGRDSLDAETTDPQNISAWEANCLSNQLKYCQSDHSASQRTQKDK